MKKPLTLAILTVLLLQTVSIGWAWQTERPHRDIPVPDRVESAYTNGEASVGLGVAIVEYNEGEPPGRYGSSDFLSMNISMTANSRVDISYEYDIGGLWWFYEDLLSSRNYLNLGDDDGTWVNIPQGIFRFYGGQYSAEYQKVWVCSNGFVAFDEREYARAPTQYTSPTPQDIPYSGAPNAIIAAVWTDLVPDASTKIFTGVYQEPFWGYTYFVITWKNIKHKLSGQRLTFQIILGNAWDYQRLVQSVIYISYMDVKAINTQFTWGIEDHQGCKGLGDLCDGASLQNFNSKTITFSQNSKSFYLKRLTITFEDTCTQTRFNILEPPDKNLCGYHISGGNEEPSPAGAFLKALMGTGALLLAAWSGAGEVVAAGFILDTSLVALDWAEVAGLATRQYRNRQVDVFDYADEEINWAEAYASTWTCVDASLSIFVDWILDDTNNDQHHSLTITAKAEYWDLTDPEYPVDKPPITTTVNLEIKPDDNNSFDKAYPIEEGTYPWLYIDVTHDPVDYYKIWVPQWYEIVVMMTIGPSYPDQDYNLYLYDPSRVLRDSSELGPGWTEYVDIVADSGGDWYIKVTTTPGDWGFYSLTVVISDLPKPPPETPSKPSGPTSGYVDTTYSYSTSTTDPNGDDICYEFDWDDDTPNTITDWYPSGETATASHSWSSLGTYHVMVKAQDETYTWSEWSPYLTVNIRNPNLIVLALDPGAAPPFNSLTTGDVYIDDEWCGLTGSTFTVLPGTHKVFVNDFWESGITGCRYGFEHWEDGPTDNPRTITVVEDTMITACFSKEYCPGDVDGSGFVDEADLDILTASWDSVRGDPNWDSRADLDCDWSINGTDMTIVTAYITLLNILANQDGNSLTTGYVYIDNEFVGHTNSTFIVSPENHTVYVSDFWESGGTGYRYSFTHWEDNSTGNPRTIEIAEPGSTTTIKAYFKKKWCPGDCNGDGHVDVSDLTLLASSWYESIPPGDPRVDLNGDDFVDVSDVTIVASNWFNEYPDP